MLQPKAPLPCTHYACPGAFHPPAVQGCNDTWHDSVLDYAAFHAEQIAKLKRKEKPDARVSNGRTPPDDGVCVCVVPAFLPLHRFHTPESDEPSLRE